MRNCWVPVGADPLVRLHVEDVDQPEAWLAAVETVLAQRTAVTARHRTEGANRPVRPVSDR
jgi:hypothetical protein